MSKKYPHGCDVDYLNEQVAEAMHAAHCEEHEAYPQKGCEWCEAEAQAEEEAQAEDAAWEAQRPVCQDCGEKALPGYVAGDRCARVRLRYGGLERACGGRLGPPEPKAQIVISHDCPRCGRRLGGGSRCFTCGLELDVSEREPVRVKCPICRQLNVKGMYCTGCGWVPPREGD